MTSTQMSLIGAPPIPNTGWKPPTGFPSLKSAKLISLDIETYDPDLLTRGPAVRRGGYIVGVSIATDDGFCGYYPIRHPNSDNFNEAAVYRWLNAELGREDQAKLGANIIYDLDYLQHAGVEVKGMLYDVQLAEPIIDENAKWYNLNSLCRKYLGEQKVESQLYAWCASAFGGEIERKQAGNIWRAPAALVGPYAEGDVLLPLRVFAKQKQVLESNGWWDAFMLETRLLPLMVKMRSHGIRVDLEKAHALDALIKESTNTRWQELYNMAGFEFEDKASDLEKVFTKFGWEISRTEAGNPSFDKKALQKYEFGRSLAAIRKFTKFRNTFIQQVVDHAINGRVHTQFHQLKSDDNGTVSYRFSSSSPSLQNIPARDKEFAKEIRSIFIPEDGELMYSCDKSQIEYRLLVHYAIGKGADDARANYKNDPTTCYHTYASQLTRKPRNDAKTINFGIVYGFGIQGLADALGVSITDARELLATYHEHLPFVNTTTTAIIRKAERTGSIKLLDGRLRRFPDKNRCYTAPNALFQGGAAIIMKKAMVDLYEAGVFNDIGIPHLTIHDELIGSIAPDKQHRVNDVVAIMEKAWPLSVPLIVNSTIGKDWGALK